jgi:hypothetical protein
MKKDAVRQISPRTVGDEVADAIQRVDPTAPLSRSGQQTAKAAARILVERGEGYVIPTATQRQNLLVAFARSGGVVYGKAFDALRLSTPINLDVETEVFQHIHGITLYEIKSTNRTVDETFSGYFFSLSTAELLVAQSLRDQFRFAFVNTSTRHVVDLSLTEVFARAKGIYPTWSIRF